MTIKIGLTGGIGSGKSTVSNLMRKRGAVVIDADQIGRDLVYAGSPALGAIAEAFGSEVLMASGELDRAVLAATVFPEPAALATLNAIMHPLIAERAAQMLATAETTGAAAIVFDMPLLVENGQAGEYDFVVVVCAPVPIRLARLAARGLAEADALARMARQATDEERARVADFIIDNAGDASTLEGAVQAVWTALSLDK